jgi:3-oxosteroid 1-dehydrogenase
MVVADSYDVVVLGSGIAGLATVLAASERGLCPLLIEKSEKLGGGTTNSYGLIWIGDNHLARAAGYEDNRADVVRYMRFLAGGEERDANLLAFVDWSPRALQFFESCGVSFRLTHGITDHYYGVASGAGGEGRTVEAELLSGYDLGAWRDRGACRWEFHSSSLRKSRSPGAGINRFSNWDQTRVRERQERDIRGKGVGLICQVLKAILARAVPILTGERIERLTLEGDRVSGIELARGRQIAARRGVVLATGGYESNPDLVRDFECLPNWLSLYPASITGDGLLLATEIGAAVRTIRNNLQLFLAFPLPSDAPREEPQSHLAGIIELCSPHTIVVNQAGKRFADESYFQGMVPALRHFDPATHGYPNLPCYLIFDQNYAATYSFAGHSAGAEIPGWVAQAEDPRVLGAKLGINTDGLAATIGRFNDFCRTGADKDFRRGELAWRLAHDRAIASGQNPSLGPLDKPPFYGIELAPAGGGSAGVLTDENAQVLHNRGKPILGLYATGSTAAKVEFGAGYQAGLTLASGMTFAYLAVDHMLKASKPIGRDT